MEEVVLLQGDEPSSVVLSFLNFLPILLVYSATTRYRAGEAAKDIFRKLVHPGKRRDPADEEDFRFEDVSHPGDQSLIHQRHANLDVRALA